MKSRNELKTDLQELGLSGEYGNEAFGNTTSLFIHVEANKKTEIEEALTDNGYKVAKARYRDREALANRIEVRTKAKKTDWHFNE